MGVETPDKPKKTGRPRIKNAKVTLAIRLRPDVRQKLDAESDRFDLSVSSLIDIASRAMLKRGVMKTLESLQ
jgi:hypothetical protein